MSNQAGSATRRWLSPFRRPSSNASTTSVSTLPEYASFTGERIEANEAPRLSHITPSDSGPSAPSQERRPSSNASTTSVSTLPEYASFTRERLEANEAPRSSHVTLRDSEPVAPSQEHLPSSNASTTSVSTLPEYASFTGERIQVIETPNSSSIALSSPEPVAPSQERRPLPRRPFRPLPQIPPAQIPPAQIPPNQIPVPQISLSRISSTRLPSRPPSISSSSSVNNQSSRPPSISSRSSVSIQSSRPPPFSSSSSITQSSRPPPFSSNSSVSNQSSRPPRYSVILSDLGGGGGEPHLEYFVPLGGPISWATLYTFTPKTVPGLVHEFQSAKRNIPTFLEGGNITGQLDLDLEATQTIQEIILTIQGTILTGSLATEIQKFLFYKHNLWHRSMGNPRDPTQRSDGRLKGSYQFSFSIPFPAHIDNDAYSNVQSVVSPFPLATGPPSADTPAPPSSSVAVQEKSRPPASDTTSVPRSAPSQAGNSSDKRPSALPQTRATNTTGFQGLFYPTPGSFAERNVSVRVQYELLIRIIHGRFRPDSKISTNIAYLPTLKPSPFSSKRREAYEASVHPPGPSQDPEGWFALPKSVIKGKLGGRQVQINCILHLATPLCYTRGSIIPCFLTLSSDDSEALDSLSTPNSPCVRLMRQLQHFSPHGTTTREGKQDSELFAGREDPSSPYTWIVPPAGDNSGKSGSLKSIQHEVGIAKWWAPPKGEIHETYVRHVEGEIHLDSELQPSSSCPLFLVEYFVELLPFVTVGFEPDPNTWDDPRKRVASSFRVEIGTSRALDEPVPIPFTEPPTAARVPSASASTSGNSASGSGSGANGSGSGANGSGSGGSGSGSSTSGSGNIASGSGNGASGSGSGSSASGSGSSTGLPSASENAQS